jgi:hypothetical protein
VRGVGWVLRWAAALAVLGVSAAVLLAFAYQLAAERAMSRAAAAGIREAALPRATSRSVDAAVRRQLANHLDLDRATEIAVERNGWLVRGAVRPRTCGRVAVTLSAPAAAALPVGVRSVLPWQQHAAITIRAERPRQ